MLHVLCLAGPSGGRGGEAFPSQCATVDSVPQWILALSTSGRFLARWTNRQQKGRKNRYHDKREPLNRRANNTHGLASEQANC